MALVSEPTGKYGKDSYYFPHDSNAKDDPKCVLLIEQLGLEGYGIYWILIETLREQPEYKYPLALVPAIARRFNTSAEKVKTVISGYSLFDFDEKDFFFSSSLIRRMSVADEVRKRLSEAGKRGRTKQLGLGWAGPGQPPGYEKRRKEKKREEMKGEEIPLPFGDHFKNSWNNWIEYRKEIKRPYKSSRAIKAALSELSKLNEESAIRCINVSIANQWQGLFPEKINLAPVPQNSKNRPDPVGPPVFRKEGTNNEDQLKKLDILKKEQELRRNGTGT